MESSGFKPNDFVWAKMAGYNHWPAIVMSPHPNAPTKTSDNMQWIYFLGTHNYSWIEDKNIKPYEEYKHLYKIKKTLAAMKEMDDIISNVTKDPNYEIPFAVFIGKKSPEKAARPSITPKEKKKAYPLQEMNTPVPRKKARLSLSNENNEIIESEFQKSPQKPITVNTMKLETSTKFFGVLAGSVCSAGIIKNLIKSRHRLYVWSNTTALCDELQKYAEQQQTFFKICTTPRQVVRSADITFSCLSDSDQAKSIINQLGVGNKNDDLLTGKGFVEMTSIDPETSKDNKELIKDSQGMYLEAMLQGNRQEAENGNLIVLAAGQQPLFDDCQSCFKAICKVSFLLGDVGTASKIHLIFQMMRGIFLASLVEGFVLADRCSIALDAFKDIFKETHMKSEYLMNKSDAIVTKQFTNTDEPVEQLQRDVSKGLELSDRYRQPMLLASNANETLKHARRMGCDTQDSSCIYRTRF